MVCTRVQCTIRNFVKVHILLLVSLPSVPHPFGVMWICNTSNHSVIEQLTTILSTPSIPSSTKSSAIFGYGPGFLAGFLSQKLVRYEASLVFCSESYALIDDLPGICTEYYWIVACPRELAFDFRAVVFLYFQCSWMAEWKGFVKCDDQGPHKIVCAHERMMVWWRKSKLLESRRFTFAGCWASSWKVEKGEARDQF